MDRVGAADEASLTVRVVVTGPAGAVVRATEGDGVGHCSGRRVWTRWQCERDTDRQVRTPSACSLPLTLRPLSEP